MRSWRCEIATCTEHRWGDVSRARVNLYTFIYSTPRRLTAAITTHAFRFNEFDQCHFKAYIECITIDFFFSSSFSSSFQKSILIFRKINWKKKNYCNNSIEEVDNGGKKFQSFYIELQFYKLNDRFYYLTVTGVFLISLLKNIKKEKILSYIFYLIRGWWSSHPLRS